MHRTMQTKNNAAVHCTGPHRTALIQFEMDFTALQCTVQYCTVLNFTASHCTALYCTELHCSALYCSALICTALQCIALHCTARPIVLEQGRDTVPLGHQGETLYCDSVLKTSQHTLKLHTAHCILRTANYTVIVQRMQ